MAGEIQLNGTSFATESSGTITVNNGTLGSAVAMSANQACVKTAINAAGSAPIYACRAWIQFDGSSGSIGTGRAAGNVSGVTDHGTGQYTITYTEAMPDANYAVALSTCRTSDGNRGGMSINFDIDEASAGGTAPASGSLKIRLYGNASAANNAVPLDADYITVAIFR